MKNIQDYERFCLNESEELMWTRHLGNNAKSYEDRAKNYYNLSSSPSILSKTQNFFQKMEDRINNMARVGKGLAQQNRSGRSGNLDTGYENLFGLVSVVPNVLKRVFGPTKFEIAKKAPAKDDEINLEFMRHTNEDFAKSELPNIRSEKQLEDNIADLYQKGEVKKGEVPVLDDIAMNRINLYYTRQETPNQPIFQPNNL
jgi:hypothetical protein